MAKYKGLVKDTLFELDNQRDSKVLIKFIKELIRQAKFSECNYDIPEVLNRKSSTYINCNTKTTEDNARELFVNELIEYLFDENTQCEIDSEVLCRKLFKYGLIKKQNNWWCR